jgi:signal transduction histidine kinase
VDGDVAGVVGVARDVTERMAHERRLKRQNERLDEFASVISHDLRNPLGVAEGHLELAREERDSQHLASIGDALERIDRIVEDVLWLARTGRDVGSTESVALRGAVAAAWAMTGDDRERAELVRRGDLGTVEADPDRLGQLLENLFRNAIEHGGEDVTVTVGPLEEGFYVEDDGPGIPPEDREDVFEAGYSTTAGGTGFGLNIVERVADAHGWAVRVTGGAGGGARFEVGGATRGA